MYKEPQTRANNLEQHAIPNYFLILFAVCARNLLQPRSVCYVLCDWQHQIAQVFEQIRDIRFIIDDQSKTGLIALF